MNIYEFVTPSDPITFKADDDKIAFLCAFFLGSGKAGCHRIDENGNQVDIPCLLMFSKEPDKKICEYIGVKTIDEIHKFVDSNRKKISECFKSFAYGDYESRKTFDDACEAITDPDKLKEFRAKHEDRNRTSLSSWVKYAWGLAEKYAKEKEAK